MQAVDLPESAFEVQARPFWNLRHPAMVDMVLGQPTQQAGLSRLAEHSLPLRKGELGASSGLGPNWR